MEKKYTSHVRGRDLFEKICRDVYQGEISPEHAKILTALILTRYNYFSFHNRMAFDASMDRIRAMIEKLPEPDDSKLDQAISTITGDYKQPDVKLPPKSTRSRRRSSEEEW